MARFDRMGIRFPRHRGRKYEVLRLELTVVNLDSPFRLVLEVHRL